MFIRNNKGLSLVEIMVAVAALGGLSIVMLQISKDQASQTVKSKVVADLGQFKTQLQSLLQHPAHCQANFYGLGSGASTPAGIYRCDVTTPNACAPGGGKTFVFRVENGAGVWTGATVVTDRIRISAININIPSTISKAVSNAKVTLTIQTRPDVGRNGAAPVVKTETVEIGVPVIMGNTGVTVVGCPKTWNTTVTY